MDADRSKNKKLLITLVVIVSVLIGVIVISKIVKLNKFRRDFDKTWNRVMDGHCYDSHYRFLGLTEEYEKGDEKYEAAMLGFEFCNVYEYYLKEDYKRAIKLLENDLQPYLDNEKAMSYLNDETREFVNKIVSGIREDYLAHKDEIEEKERQELAEAEAYLKQKEEEEEARKKAAPYVGMPESKIDSTDLGVHSEYHPHFNTEVKNGNVYHASMYYWNVGNDCIYSARCVDGSVYNVWDNRDRHVKNNTTRIINESKNKSKKNKKESTTEFDPDDHDIEMYYEDYKDIEGFEDIDDAYDDFEDNPEYWDDY